MFLRWLLWPLTMPLTLAITIFLRRSSTGTEPTLTDVPSRERSSCRTDIQIIRWFRWFFMFNLPFLIIRHLWLYFVRLRIPYFSQELYRKGHDISVHSISHNNDPNYWTRGSVEDWTSEMVGHKFILEEFAKIPSREVSGMRAPHLRVGANSQVIVSNLWVHFSMRVGSLVLG